MKGASERNGWPLTHDAVQRRADLEEIFQPVLNGMSEQQRAQWGSWYSGPISMPPKVNSRAASGITVALPTALRWGSHSGRNRSKHRCAH